MKTTHLTLILSCLLLSATSLKAQTTTAINGGNIENAGNWTAGLPTVGSGNTGLVNTALTWSVTGGVDKDFTWNVQQSDGTVEETGDQNLTWSDGSYAISAGTLQHTDTDKLLQFTGNDTTLSGTGTISAAYRVVMNGTASTFDMSGGNLTIGAASGNGLFVAGNTEFTFSGGTIDASSELQLNNNAFLRFSGSGAGTVAADALDILSNAYIDFETGNTGSLTIDGFTSTNYESLWTANTLKFNDANTGLFTDHFDVTGSTLTVIPEPSSLVLLICAITVITVTCRKKR